MPHASVQATPPPAFSQPATQSTTQPATQPAAEPDTSTPRAAALAILDANQRRDLRGMSNLMEWTDPATVRAGQLRLWASAVNLRFNDAARQAFGESAKGRWPRQGQTFQGLRKSIEAAQESIDGDWAVLKEGEGKEVDIRLHKTPQGWRLVPYEGLLRPFDITGLRFVAAENRVTDEIVAGKLKTAKEANDAIQRYAEERLPDLLDLNTLLGEARPTTQPASEPTTRPAATQSGASLRLREDAPPAVRKLWEQREELRQQRLAELIRQYHQREREPTNEEKIQTRLDTNMGAAEMFNWINAASDDEKAFIFNSLLKRYASASDPGQRLAYLVCIAMFPDKATDILEQEMLSDSERSVRELAAHLLGGCGTDKQVDALLKAVAEDRGVFGSGRTIAAAAITSLGRIGGDRAGEALKRIWSDPQLSAGSKEVLISSAGTSGYSDLLGLVVGVLDGQDESIRDNAAYALGKLGELNPEKPDVVKAAVVALRRCLTDQNPNVRRNAVTALGEIGTRDDIVQIQALFKDAHVETLSYSENGQKKTRQVYPVRDRAKESIEKIIEREGSDR